MRTKTAAILIIGDEILSGKFADENAPFLIGELRALGLPLKRIETLPDDRAVISESVARVAAEHEVVFTSGGVGPTHDDVTMEGIAQAFGVPVVRHEGLAQLLRGFYQEKLTDGHLRMADVPQGTDVITTDHPSWPVMLFQNVYILPGVPALFRAKFASMRERFRVTPWVVQRVYLDADEGSLAEAMTLVAAAHPDVQIGSYPRFDTKDYRVLVTFESKDGPAVMRARDDLLGRVPPKSLVRMD